MKLFLCAILLTYVWIGSPVFGERSNSELWERLLKSGEKEAEEIAERSRLRKELRKAPPAARISLPFSAINVDAMKIRFYTAPPTLHLLYSLSYSLHHEHKGITAIYRSNLLLRDLEFLQSLFSSQRIESITVVSEHINYDSETITQTVTPCSACSFVGFQLRQK